MKVREGDVITKAEVGVLWFLDLKVEGGQEPRNLGNL